MLLSRLTLRANGKDRATVATFSFCIDRSLLNAFCPGDTLHLVRTGCGGLGLSLIREGRLIVAIGAVNAVPQENSSAFTIPPKPSKKRNVRSARSIVTSCFGNCRSSFE